MADLIPEDYRRRLRLARWLRALAWTCALFALLAGAARLGLAHLIQAEHARLAVSRQLQAATGTHRAKLAELRARKNAVERQILALETLQGPAVLDDLFFAIDAAATGKIWFDEFSFARAAEPIDAKLEAREPGTFISTPLGAAAMPHARAGQGAGAAAEPTVRNRPRAQFRGQALDHAALAEFIKRFASQPGIATVHLVDAGVHNGTGLPVVDFQLAAVLGPRAETPR